MPTNIHNTALQKNPIQFLRQHMLDFSANWKQTLVNTGETQVHLIEAPSNTVTRKMDGAVIKCVEVSRANLHPQYDNPLTIYWVPYQPNRISEGRIARDCTASLFLTDGLSGCGVLIEKNTIEPKISHVDGGRYSNAQMRQMAGKTHHLLSAAEYEPADDGTRAVLLGYNISGTWRFIAQKTLMVKASTYQMTGLMTVP